MIPTEKFTKIAGMSIEAIKDEVKKLNGITTTTPALQDVKARIRKHFDAMPKRLDIIHDELVSMGFVRGGEARTSLLNQNPNYARFDHLDRSNPFKIVVYRGMHNGTSGVYGSHIYYSLEV